MSSGGYDSFMSYPPQGQPGDPGSQPPPGGYLPGQAGPQYSPQPPQYTQPDPSAGYQQPGYGPPPPQQPYVDPYQQQYGPPPVQPTSKGGAGTAILIVIVLVLMVGGGVAGYLLLGGDDEGTTTAGDETTTEASDEEEPTEGGGEEPTEDGDAPPATDGLTVASLGAATPFPASGDWQPNLGPGGLGRLSDDAQGAAVDHGDGWISYMEVGVVTAVYMEYDPADLVTSAETAMEYWTVSSGAFESTEDTRVTATEFTNTEVDGRPAVLAEARVSWSASDSTTDLYEDVAIVLVDADGVNGFLGIASVPESGTDDYQAAVDALLATTFEGESGGDV